MKFGKVSKTKDLNEYDDVRIVGKTFPDNEAAGQIKNRTMNGMNGQSLTWGLPVFHSIQSFGGRPLAAPKYAVAFYKEYGYNNYSNRKGEHGMPNIKPVSDLRNYTEVLRDIAVGEPVFLTKNGRGRYAIVDMEEYEKTRAVIKLMGELSKGEKSAQEKGWADIADVEKLLGVTNG